MAVFISCYRVQINMSLGTVRAQDDKERWVTLRLTVKWWLVWFTTGLGGSFHCFAQISFSRKRLVHIWAVLSLEAFSGRLFKALGPSRSWIRYVHGIQWIKLTSIEWVKNQLRCMENCTLDGVKKWDDRSPRVWVFLGNTALWLPLPCVLACLWQLALSGCKIIII